MRREFEQYFINERKPVKVIEKKSLWHKFFLNEGEYIAPTLQDDFVRIENFKNHFAKDYPWVQCIDMNPKNHDYQIICWYLLTRQINPDRVWKMISAFDRFFFNNYIVFDTVGFENISVYVYHDEFTEYVYLKLLCKDEATLTIIKLIGLNCEVI